MKKREANTYFTLGLRLLHDDDCKRAISLLSIAIDLDSHFAEAYGYRGIAHFTLGMHQKATEDFNTALSLDPSLNKIYYFRATLHLVEKHYEEAINDFTSAITLDSVHPETPCL
jgi:tetratricopeptide (TPR) repeat protein